MDPASTTIQSIKIPVISPDYVSLLERVNDINATGLALANVFVAILAMVLTIVSIFVAIYIWRTSREQKEERQKFYSEHATQMTEQYQVLVTTYEEKIKSLVDKIEDINKTAEDTGNGMSEAKKQLEALVTDYQSKIIALGSRNNTSSHDSIEDIPMATKLSPWRLLDNTQTGVLKMMNAVHDVKHCPHCGKQYKVAKFDYTLSGSLYSNACPHCGRPV